MLDGRLAIRAAIVNHRTGMRDIEALVSAVLEFGARQSGSLSPHAGTGAG
jgi:aromatic-L-amino-acid decarboxylase